MVSSQWHKNTRIHAIPLNVSIYLFLLLSILISFPFSLRYVFIINSKHYSSHEQHLLKHNKFRGSHKFYINILFHILQHSGHPGVLLFCHLFFRIKINSLISIVLVWIYRAVNYTHLTLPTICSV